MIQTLPALAGDDAPSVSKATNSKRFDRQQALVELRTFRLGSTLTVDRIEQLEALHLPPHAKDQELISAYQFEALAAAWWLFCVPPGETHQATELQVYLAEATTLRGRDDGVPPPFEAKDGLRGARVVYRRFVRCEGEAKPYFMSVYAIIPFTVVRGQGRGSDRVRAKLAPLDPPDNLRIRCEVDDGVFIGLPFDFDDGTLRPHVHYNADNKPCLYGEHGQTLACGQPLPRHGIIRADAQVASAQMCASCHQNPGPMIESKRFTSPREEMAGYLQLARLAHDELGASAIDLEEIRALLRDPSNMFIPPDLPQAIEAAWLENYPDYCKCRDSLRAAQKP